MAIKLHPISTTERDEMAGKLAMLAPGYRPLTAAADRILHQILLAQFVDRLSKQLVTATPEAPRAFRGATAAELRAHLSALPEPELKFFADLLTGIQRDGLAQFDTPKGAKPLPAELAASLDKGELKLSDLSSPVLALGDLAQYDLSKWQPKGKKK